MPTCRAVAAGPARRISIASDKDRIRDRPGDLRPLADCAAPDRRTRRLLQHHGAASYAAAKAALYGLAKALAFEGAEHGIRVNLLLPLAYTAIAADSPIPDFAEHRARHIPPGTDVQAPERATPEINAHVVGYLASRACAINGEAISVCRSRYGRLFVGVADGWLPPDVAAVSAEAVAEHLDEIRDLGAFTVPSSYYDEMASVTRRLRALD